MYLRQMRVAIVQCKSPHDFDESLARLKRFAMSAKRSDATILVTPELFLGGYRTDGVTAISDLDLVATIARDVEIHLIVGFAEKLSDGVANSAVAIDKYGKILGVYRKCHLFGELENRAFRRGNTISKLFHFDNVRVGILICYDVEFPEAVRTVAMRGADIIFVPTANFHPFDFINDKIIEVRAFENRVPLVYCNWSEHKNKVPPKVEFNGKSIVVDENGKALLRLRPSDEGIWIVNVPVRSRNAESTSESDYLRDRRPELYSTRASKL